jgi:hypothetical protein
MDDATVRSERLRSHRLTAPARTVAAAAAHMLATQAQEFWGGRWALASRTTGAPTIRDVDASFDRGEIVRSWTMRGTIHIIPSRDLAWVLSLTGARQVRQGAAIHRREGIDDGTVARAERAARDALAGGNRLTRRELFEVFEMAGVDASGQRGYHLLTRLSAVPVIVQGPVVAREGAPSREQYFVLVDEWIREQAEPADPLAEFFVRFIASHGPAGVRDFAWWSGLPLGDARRAAEGAEGRIVQVDDDRYTTLERPRRRAGVPTVLALPPFEEYYLSYADRSIACAPGFLDVIGPSMNGMVRPILVSRGEAVGVWRHSVAVGRHADDPVPELFVPGAATDSEIAAALDRYRRFITA